MTPRMGQEVRSAMLTRIRFEAEGATPGDCRRDLYAAAERLLSTALARIYKEPESDADFSVRMSSWVHEEVYSALPWDERVPQDGRLYKGRLVIGLPVGPPEQTFTDAVFRYGHLSDAELAAAAEKQAARTCEHPSSALRWNPHSAGFECSRCGSAVIVADRGDVEVLAVQPPHGRTTR